MTELSLKGLPKAVCFGANLNTSIPDSITLLQHLEVINMTRVTLRGSFPQNIGNMTSLRVLDFNRGTTPFLTGFGGPIPDSFANLKRLEVLVLTGSEIAPFASPVTLALPLLREVRLDYSPQLKSRFSSFFAASPLLEVLTIKTTPFYGSVTFLKDLSHLRELDLAGSLVSGILPDDFWKIRSLEIITILNGRLFGSITSEIGQMANLTVLQIGNTGMRGDIPPEIGLCSKLEIIQIMWTNNTGPIPSELGNLSNLTALTLLGLRLTGTIPDSLSRLQNLEVMALSSGLVGTLPNSFEKLTQLGHLGLSGNSLEGTIPNIMHTRGCEIDLNSNSFTGTIPPSIATNCGTITLHTNNLGPHLPRDTFLNNTNHAITINLAHNNFRDKLPLLPPPNNTFTPPITIQISFNSFHGSIPASYCASVASFDASSNKLSAGLDELVGPGCFLNRLFLDHNHLSGTIPTIKSKNLRELDVSHNDFSLGSLPPLPDQLITFSASNNNISDADASFWNSVVKGNLAVLDLSSNRLSCPDTLFELFQTDHLESVSLANNTFECQIYFDSDSQGSSSLRHLDLSDNFFIGLFPPIRLPQLVSLNLSNNLFFGPLVLSSMPRISTFDISHNEFSFSFAQFTDLPYLVNIKAQANNIYGTLLFEAIDALQTANFSQNLLASLDLASISSQFSSLNLALLSMTQNRFPPFESLQTPTSGLSTSLTSTPSTRFPIICYRLAVAGKPEIQFNFDEDLFSYSQCECDHEHFGSPPNDCQLCPTAGVEACNGPTLVSSKMTYLFVFEAPNQSIQPSSASVELGNGETSLSLENGSETLGQPHLRRGIRLETESCIYSAEQTRTRTNCRSIEVDADQLFNASISLESLLKHQCANGSTGRLCSKCVCDQRGLGECYYLSSGECHKCSRVLPLGTSIGLLIATLVASISALTTIMFFLLQSKRTLRLTSWEKLPRWRRFLYRIVYLTTLGNVSILITHIQLLVEFTHFDALLFSLVRSLNGSLDGFGLQCAFPFLSNPMAFLIVKLSVPFVAISVIVISVGLAELLSRVWAAYRVRKLRRSISSASRGSQHSHITRDIDITAGFQVNEEEDPETQFLLRQNESSGDLPDRFDSLSSISHVSPRQRIQYPAMALATSLSIQALKFFYFGTALSAHEYLFWRIQSHTSIAYVLNHPWMSYAQAFPLIMVSLPAILMFDILLPVGFLFLCYRFRKSFKSPDVAIYFGSLFETFANKRFYWGMNDILRKLGIALVLRSIASPNAFTDSTVLTILVATLFGQILLQPWKRKVENAFDSLSSLLLILSVSFPMNFRQPYYHETSVILDSFQLLFVLASLVVIVWQTLTGRTEYEKRIAHHAQSLSDRTSSQLESSDKEEMEHSLPKATSDGFSGSDFFSDPETSGNEPAL